MNELYLFLDKSTTSTIIPESIFPESRGDSYYEYLLKQWLQTGKSIEYLKKDYNESMFGVRQNF